MSEQIQPTSPEAAKKPEARMISSADRSEVRGTIDPAKPEKAQALNENIAALTKQKEAAAANLAEIDAKMEEIKNGPKNPDTRDLDLKVLNQYQEERNRVNERYGSLARKIAEKKIELQDLSN